MAGLKQRAFSGIYAWFERRLGLKSRHRGRGASDSPAQRQLVVRLRLCGDCAAYVAGLHRHPPGARLHAIRRRSLVSLQSLNHQSRSAGFCARIMAGDPTSWSPSS